MPLYEFQCDTCGARLERIQKYTDPPPDACPKCGGAMTKLLSSPAIQFKGSGFYITDYARKGEGSGKGEDKGAESKGTDKSSSGKESGKESSKEASAGTKGGDTATAAPKADSSSSESKSADKPKPPAKS